MKSTPVPTVVIPVYNAFDEFRACLASVAETVGSGTQVMIIDDASSDKRVVPFVEQLMAESPGPRWRFVRQPRNSGFVETANLGMRLAHGDVVLLNSDTEVPSGWLERLAACLASDDGIATCTPWSNNGEIVSMPRFCHANAAPANLSAIAEVIAAFFDERGGPRYPELPTAVGFCMAISRKAIDTVGAFDAARFGKGYGEENDFSLRVREHGFRNVLCDNAYVVHHGGRSFGPLGLEPDEMSMQRLLERHPGYLAEVEAFIQADPLRPDRERICASIVAAGLAFD